MSPPTTGNARSKTCIPRPRPRPDRPARALPVLNRLRPRSFAVPDQACLGVDSRDKIGVLHTTASVCAIAVRIGDEERAEGRRERG